MNFSALDHQNSPILLCNVWDVMSAKVAQKLNFSVIGTSSSAMAAMLGYRDGEEITFQELEFLRFTICRCFFCRGKNYLCILYCYLSSQKTKKRKCN